MTAYRDQKERKKIQHEARYRCDVLTVIVQHSKKKRKIRIVGNFCSLKFQLIFLLVNSIIKTPSVSRRIGISLVLFPWWWDSLSEMIFSILRRDVNFSHNCTMKVPLKTEKTGVYLMEYVLHFCKKKDCIHITYNMMNLTTNKFLREHKRNLFHSRYTIFSQSWNYSNITENISFPFYYTRARFNTLLAHMRLVKNAFQESLFWENFWFIILSCKVSYRSLFVTWRQYHRWIILQFFKWSLFYESILVSPFTTIFTIIFMIIFVSLNFNNSWQYFNSHRLIYIKWSC